MGWYKKINKTTLHISNNENTDLAALMAKISKSNIINYILYYICMSI